MNFVKKMRFVVSGVLVVLGTQAYAGPIANSCAAPTMTSWYSQRLARPYDITLDFDAETTVEKVAQLDKKCDALLALPYDEIATFCWDEADSLSGALYRFDRGGNQLGATKLRLSTAPALLADGTIVAANQTTVYWIKQDKIIHTYKSESSSFGSVAVLSDNTIVVPDNRRDARILWLKDGAFKQELPMTWPAAAGVQSTEATVAVEADDSIYVASSKPWTGPGKLSWIDAKAQLRAESDIDMSFAGPPVVYRPGKLIVAGFQRGKGGRVLWFGAKNPDGFVQTSEHAEGLVNFGSSGAAFPDGRFVIGTVNLDGKTLYLKNGKLLSSLHCVLPEDSEVEECGWQASPPALLKDGTVIVVNQSGIVQWWKPGKKEVLRWSFPDKRSNVIYAPVILSDGTVVANSHNGTVAWLRLSR